MIQLVIDAYRTGETVPVLTHIFRGQSFAEVKALYDMHMQHDAMLSSCTLLRHFLDFDCETLARWEQVTWPG